MTTFFKKIRQKIINKDKLGSYILYALGEIFLVVIGILIAVQINTANQNRQRAKLERVLLEQVKNELLNIYQDVWRDKARLEWGNKSHSTISKYINQDKAYVDSLCFDFDWIKSDEYIYPVNAAYLRLKDEGLDIIKNDTIRIYIREIYEGVFPRIMKNNSFTPDISKVFNEYYLNNFIPNTNYDLQFKRQIASDTIGSIFYSQDYFEYPDVNEQTGEKSTVGYVPLDFSKLKKDTKFQMLLEQTKRYRDYKVRRYSFAKMGIEEVVIRINKELDN